MRLVLLLLNFVFAVFGACDEYRHDAKLCISQGNEPCIYNVKQKSCLSSKDDFLSCSTFLSIKLCQLQSYPHSCIFIFPTRGIFLDSCQPVTQSLLSQFECKNLPVSKHTCLTLKSDTCVWNDDSQTCDSQTYQTIEKGEDPKNCEGVFTKDVPPKACASIPFYACSHQIIPVSPYGAKYICKTVQPKELTTLKCDASGLSEKACRTLQTKNQQCRFDNFQCNTLGEEELEKIKCNMRLNRNACVRVVTEPCTWNSEGEFCFENNTNEKKNVNSISCTLLPDGPVMYDPEANECREIKEEDLQRMECTQEGLNKSGCLLLNQNCYYYEGRCMSLKNITQYSCEGKFELNKLACLNNNKDKQHCIWNAKATKCESLEINSQTACESLKLVNGQACMAVEKEPCKYNQSERQCQISRQSDQCVTPFINMLGCVQITLTAQTCQWDFQCKFFQIVRRKNICNQLQYVNAQVCADFEASLEDPDKLCMYDEKLKGCRVVASQELKVLKCGVASLGLNDAACASITTNGEVCHFQNGLCTAYDPPKFLSSQPCSHYRNANAEVCARVDSQQKEWCVYDKKNFSCTSQMKPEQVVCSTIGLNISACQAVRSVGESCYFNIEEMKCKQISDLSLISCNDGSSYYTCVGITTPGQSCQYDNRKDTCTKIITNAASPCQLYTDVNSIVCTQIRHDDPSPQTGICFYDIPTSSCKPINSFNEKCSGLDPCCTEKLGINSHYCSMFSDPNTYCYFDQYDGKCKFFNVGVQALAQIDSRFNKQEKISCYYVNYALCGLIYYEKNSQRIYCYQKSPESPCRELSEPEYAVTDPKKFLDPQVRANVFVCISIDKPGYLIKYNKTLGRCDMLSLSNNNLVCSEEFINVGTCISLTKQDFCKWDKKQLKCIQIQPSEVQELPCTELMNVTACVAKKGQCRFNPETERCEQMPQVTKGTCNLESEYRVGPEICAQLEGEHKSCRYDEISFGCVETKRPSDSCFGVGFNKFSCFAFTSGFCEWNPEKNLCQEFNDPEVRSCNDLINKHACLKVTTKGQTCAWNPETSSCEFLQINDTVTCEELQKSSKQYNLLTCLAISAPVSYCTYNFEALTCESRLCEKEPCVGNEIRLNESCDARLGNIHFCLGRTKSHYCKWNPQELRCETYIKNPQQTFACETSNINREICMVLTNDACMFSLAESKCKSFTVKPNTLCTDLYPSKTELFNKRSCTSINPNLNPSSKQKFVKPECNGAKPVCAYERYCVYKPEQDGCRIEDSTRRSEESSTQDGYSNCKVQALKLTKCSDQLSEALCLQQVAAACVFVNGICKAYKDVDAINLPDKCESYSYISCTMQTKLCCQVKREQNIPSHCNIPEAYYLTCKPLALDSQSDSCYKIPLLQEIYGLEGSAFEVKTNLRVSQKCCSRIKAGICIYDEPSESCQVLQYQPYQCNLAGQSHQACSVYFCNYENDECFDKVVQALQCEKYVYSKRASQWEIQQKRKDCFQNKNPPCGWLSSTPNPYRGIKWSSCSPSQDIETCVASAGCEDCANQNQCISCYKNAQITYNNAYNNAHSTYSTGLAGCQAIIRKTIGNDTFYCTYSSFSECDDDPNKGSCNCLCFSTIETNRNTALTNASSNLSQDQSQCDNKNECDLQVKPCQTAEVDPQTLSALNSKYSAISNSPCIQSKGQAALYDEQNGSCSSLSEPSYFCRNLNELGCLKSRAVCIWSDKKCKAQNQNNLKTRTDCDNVSAGACKYIEKASCEVRDQICVQSGNVSQCSGLSQEANVFSCVALNIKMACYHDKTRCSTWVQIKSAQQCMNSGYQVGCLYCDSPGLNRFACLMFASGYCQFTSGEGCKTIGGFFYIQSCTDLGKHSCLNVTTKNCYWDNQLAECQEVKYGSIKSCDQFQLNQSLPNLYSYNLASCANIFDENSRQKCSYFESKCVTIAQPVGCQVMGINRHGCLEMTNEPCEFRDGLCLATKSFLVKCQKNDCCAENLNWIACVRQFKQLCEFSQGKCQAHKSLDALSLTEIKDRLTSPGVFYSPEVCKFYQFAGLPLEFDPEASTCKVVTRKDLACSHPNINRTACLENTAEYCQWVGGLCQEVKFGVFSNPETKCEQIYNQKACLAIQLQICNFSNGLCQFQSASVGSCAGAESVTKLFCQTRVEQPCLFVAETKSCKVPSQMENNFRCTIEGLNQKACYFHTKGYTCVFRDGTCSDLGVGSSALCTDPINEKACSQIHSPGSFCTMEETCKELVTEDQKLPFQKNCITGKTVNLPVCTLAEDSPCRFDHDSGKCVKADGQENCRLELGLNQLGCQMNRSMFGCLWFNHRCNVVAQEKFSQFICSDPVNKLICVSISKSGQYCQFTKDKCNQVDLDSVDLNLNFNCSELDAVNSSRFCELATDKKCKFNAEEKKCQEVTAKPAACERGLNKEACEWNEECLFRKDWGCIMKNLSLECESFSVQQHCISHTEPCYWRENKCVRFSQSEVQNCEEFNFPAGQLVCPELKPIATKACLRDPQDQKCKLHEVRECNEVLTLKQCTSLQSKACLWKEALKQCQDFIASPGFDGCATIGSMGNLLACKMIRKSEQYCQYYEGKCQRVDYKVNGWENSVNYNACIAQQSKACLWINNNCDCPSASRLSEIQQNEQCNENLSYLLCLSINNYCIWRYFKCQLFSPNNDIIKSDVSDVTARVCSLVNDGTAVHYDQESKTCQDANSTDGCNFPGLNNNGCLIQKLEACKFQNHRCRPYK